MIYQLRLEVGVESGPLPIYPSILNQFDAEAPAASAHYLKTSFAPLPHLKVRTTTVLSEVLDERIQVGLGDTRLLQG